MITSCSPAVFSFPQFLHPPFLFQVSTFFLFSSNSFNCNSIFLSSIFFFSSSDCISFFFSKYDWYLFLEDLTEVSILLLIVTFLKPPRCFMPVSYTHLDVYKRQVVCVSVISYSIKLITLALIQGAVMKTRGVPRIWPSGGSGIGSASCKRKKS